MSKEIAVKVENLTKTFHIPLEAHSGLKQKLINTIKGRKGYREFSPLNGVSFEIEKGDFFGIVGRNGSGKSTLLKTLAGIYSPDGGAVHVNGTLVPFIELGVGFNPELTGRENVFLNGALLGFSRSEMEAMYDDIVDFAELHDFMEERLKNYSSGMQVRLAFSIAIRADGDILLLDEVLAVGDEAFQKKCFDYFEDLKQKGKTVILVSHDMASVRKFCNKALLIDRGLVAANGTPDEVAALYSELNQTATFEDRLAKNIKLQSEHGVKVALEGGKKIYKVGDLLSVGITWPSDLEVAIAWVDVYTKSGVHVCNFVSNRESLVRIADGAGVVLETTLNLGPGEYYIDVSLWDEAMAEKLVEMYPACEFLIDRDWSNVGVRFGGMTQLTSRWKVIDRSSKKIPTGIYKDLVIAIQNDTQYYSIRPLLEYLKSNKYSFDIAVNPMKWNSDGFQRISSSVEEVLRVDGFNPIIASSLDKRYKVLLAAYHDAISVPHDFSLSYLYAMISAKPSPVYLPMHQKYFHGILCQSYYEAEILDVYAKTYVVSSLKYLDFKRQAAKKSKKTVLYLPTWGTDSSLNEVETILEELKKEYYVITKMHHGTAYLSDEDVRRDVIKSLSDEVYDSRMQLSELMARADVVLSDNSGVIFESLYAGVPVATISNDLNTHRLGSIETLQFKMAKDGSLPHAGNVHEVNKTLELAMTDKVRKIQDEKKKTLFPASDGVTSWVNVIDSYIAGNVNKDYIKLHNLYTTGDTGSSF